MQGPKLEHLVESCANVAAQGKNIQSYVIVYQTKCGTINYHRDGNWTSQVGMLDAVKNGIISGCK